MSILRAVSALGFLQGTYQETLTVDGYGHLQGLVTMDKQHFRCIVLSSIAKSFSEPFRKCRYL